MATVATSVLMAGVPTMMTACHQLAKHGWMSPLVGCRRHSGEFLTYVVAHLSLLLRRDVDFYPLSGLGLL
jgi:hypothetical protein